MRILSFTMHVSFIISMALAPADAIERTEAGRVETQPVISEHQEGEKGYNAEKSEKSQQPILESHEGIEKHASHTKPPAYVENFIDIFKKGTIHPDNFDEQLYSTVFSQLEFRNANSSFLSMKELHQFVFPIEESGIKNNIFQLLKEMEEYAPDQVSNGNKKFFFILNHLLENPETINFSKKYLKQFMNTAFGYNFDYATYAFVLLDSGTSDDQKLALKYLNTIFDHPGMEGNLPSILQQIGFVKNQTRASPFINFIIKSLPNYTHTNAHTAFQIAAVLFDHSDYHQAALEFIDNSLKLKEIQKENPLTFTARILLPMPETTDYATRLIEKEILPNPTIKAKDKWMTIQNLLWKDSEKALRYLTTLWEVNHEKADRIQLLFEIMNYQALQAFLLSKVGEYFDSILEATKTMPEHEIGMKLNTFVQFLSTCEPDTLRKMQDKIRNLVNTFFHLPENVLPMIQPVHVLTLIQNCGLNIEKALLFYSESPTVAPQFFINLSYNIPEKEKFLLSVYTPTD